MLGVDTNVLIRLLVADDAAQTRKARLLVEKCAARHETVLVSLPVIVEVEWVSACWKISEFIIINNDTIPATRMSADCRADNDRPETRHEQPRAIPNQQHY